MTKCIVQVWFEKDPDEPDRKAKFQMIETELPDFATFCELVEADRLIGGAILWTRRSTDCQIVQRRVPTAFRGSTVVRCQLPTWTFREDDVVAPVLAEVSSRF